MVAHPHDDPAFANSLVYTIAVTVRVRGGVRSGTTDRRAQAVAERLANHAARAKHVVETTADIAENFGGKLHWTRPVHFAAANSGKPSHGEPAKLDRYLDPEHERGLASLAAHNARHRALTEADRDRRLALGCPNACRLIGARRPCDCVYCQPDDHYVAVQLQCSSASMACGPPPCVCGRHTPTGERCESHRNVEVVALEGDPDSLHVLADARRDID